MTWFEQLTGILETSPTRVRDQLTLDDDCLICPSGKRLAFGALETPTLAELRDQVRQSDVGRDGMSLREQVADVKQLHADEANAGALFQVASQFNLLEMASPSVTPDWIEFPRRSKWQTINSESNFLLAFESESSGMLRSH